MGDRDTAMNVSSNMDVFPEDFLLGFADGAEVPLDWLSFRTYVPIGK